MRAQEAPLADQVHFYFEAGHNSRQLNAQALFTQPDRQSHVYVCGPTGLWIFVLNAARANGWPEAQLHKEYFAAAPTAKSTDSRFEVQILSTGQTLSAGRPDRYPDAGKHRHLCACFMRAGLLWNVRHPCS